MFPTEYSIPPTSSHASAEERGFESLWFPEHTPHPREPQEPLAGRRRRCRKDYWSRLDPFVALMAAAGGHKDAQARHRHLPGHRARSDLLAKEVATLDLLSGGRVLFGIGGGWNAEEMENHGTDFETPLEAAARAHAGDEGDLDAGRGRVTTASSCDFDPIWS